MSRTLAIAIALLLGLAGAPAMARTWSSASGTFKVEAELVEARADGTLILKRPDGQVVAVKLERLSQADQDFVRQQSAPAPRAENAADTASHNTATPDAATPDAAADHMSPAAHRNALPDAKEVAKKVSELRDLLKDEYQKARASDDGRQEFLNKLTELANESLPKDMAGAFAAVSLAADVSASWGDLAEALTRLAWLEERFQIADGPVRRVALAGRLKVDSLTPAMAAADTVQLLSIMEEREDAADYEGAMEMGRLAMRTIRQANESKKLAQIAARGRKLKEQKEIYEAVAASLETLKAKPQDPAANLVVGNFLCLVRGKWAQGLPHLAASEDAEMAPVAKRDLSRVASTADQAGLADQWWGLSEQPKYRTYADELMRRSAYWYRQAAPQMIGLDKLRAEKRIKSAPSEPAAVVIETPAQPSVPKSKTPREPKNNGAPGWLVLFRSGDPSIWDSDSRQVNHYAIPLDRVPEEIKFLKLKRMDTNAAIIIPISKAQLRTQVDGERVGWMGTNKFEWKAFHLGIYNKQWVLNRDMARGQIAITHFGPGRDGAGWGFGHKVLMNDRQYFAWGGQEINPTVFEISVTTRPLTKADESLLVK
ncbi:MAG: hypothetical protein K8T25_15940 [Planctomycetia bacterium]|nr:hypothetical protein [Planctomycetia bacterium]